MRKNLGNLKSFIFLFFIVFALASIVGEMHITANLSQPAQETSTTTFDGGTQTCYFFFKFYNLYSLRVCDSYS